MNAHFQHAAIAGTPVLSFYQHTQMRKGKTMSVSDYHLKLNSAQRLNIKLTKLVNYTPTKLIGPTLRHWSECFPPPPLTPMERRFL